MVVRMSYENIDLSLPPDFANQVRLFPLPNLVVFPGIVQGLHIFEPRYRALLEDSVEADGLITMATLRPEARSAQRERPGIFPVVCIGRVVTRATLEDGRSNLLLMGLKRARITRELELGTPYRMAAVELLEDARDIPQHEVSQLRNRLSSLFDRYADARNLEREPIQHLLSNELPLGLLADLIAFAISESMEFQIRILATPQLGRRAKMVIQMLKQHLGRGAMPPQASGFPPRFSVN